MTAKYGIPYFSNYVNSDMNPSDVRSMAILGTQDVIYKDKFGRISKDTINHLVSQWLKNPENTKYSILMNGVFVPIIDMFEVPYDKYDTYVEVSLETGQSQKFSYDHKCVIVRDGKMIEEYAQNIHPGDYALFAKNGYNESSIGTYESGKIVGYYLAEGWSSHNGADINFAINIQRQDICDAIKRFFESNFASRVVVNRQEDTHIFRISVFGRGANEFVHSFVSGDSAKTKRLTTVCYDTSLEFRQGMYDGYMETDGSEKNKVFAHTTNKELCQDMIKLFATIGRYFKYQVNPNNTRYFKKDKTDFERFTSYKLYTYSPQSFNDEYYMIPITDIVQQNASRINVVYNFTVDTSEHLYELPNGMITHQCCRLRLDLRELRRKSGGYFGSGENTGSIGVVTINLPRLAHLSKTKEEFFERLDKLMDIAARSLNIKREVITQHFQNGLYPYTKAYLKGFDDHFSTLGIVGMNECCLNAEWLKESISGAKSYRFAQEVLDHMREKLSDYQELYGCLFNLEATPAESTCYRFAKHDLEQYPDIITAGGNGKAPYYTNSSHLPVGYTDDIFEALDHQDELQTKYTSGTVFHAFLGEKLPDWKSAMQLTRKIAENYRLPYFTFSPTYSICTDHGYLVGEQWKCPHCGKDTEVYSRVTGYYRAVQNFNDGKRQEFAERKEYVFDSHAVETVSKHEETEPPAIEESPKIDIAARLKTPILITTSTCPNCKIARQLLSDSGFEHTVIIASEDMELVKALDINQAPTLVIMTEDGEIQKIANVSNISKYLESL